MKSSWSSLVLVCLDVCRVSASAFWCRPYGTLSLTYLTQDLRPFAALRASSGLTMFRPFGAGSLSVLPHAHTHYRTREFASRREGPVGLRPRSPRRADFTLRQN